MLSWQLTNALTALLIPPGLLILVLAAGLAVLSSLPKTGRMLLITATAGLYLLAMPLTGTSLLQYWETPPVDPGHLKNAQAIVVLGGGKYPQAPEYGGDTVAAMSLVRLRYAAALYRQTGLPVLVSGGSPEGSPTDEAQTMRRTLEQEFAVPVRWSEGRSANTLENARLTRDLLDKEGIRRIALVTVGDKPLLHFTHPFRLRFWRSQLIHALHHRDIHAVPIIARGRADVSALPPVQFPVRLEALDVLRHDEEIIDGDRDMLCRIVDQDPVLLVGRTNAFHKAAGMAGARTSEHVQDIRHRNHDVPRHGLQAMRHRRDGGDDVEPAD